MSREISMSLPSPPTTLENFRSSNESLVDNFISDILSSVSVNIVSGTSTQVYPTGAGACAPSTSHAQSSSTSPQPAGLPLCAACLPAARPARLQCSTCGGEPLCDACAHAHRRVLLTRDHDIGEAPTSSSSNGWRRTAHDSEGSSSPPGASGGSAASSISPPTSTTCCLHPSNSLQCTDCTSTFNSDLDQRQNLSKLQRDVRGATSAIRQALDDVQKTAEKVDHKAFSVASEVRKTMRRFISAFEARELELLRRIEQGRQVKISLLQSQLENLRVCYTRLALASENISESLGCGDMQEVGRCTQLAVRELRQARGIQGALLPCEDDGFVFVAPPESCFTAINSMGKLKISSAAADSSFFSPPKETAAASTTRYRPIYGASSPVIVSRDPPAANRPVLTFGSEGENDGQLCRPWGIACGQDGRFVVADRSNNRIQVFDSCGRYMFKFGTRGTGPGQFDRPAGVAVGPRGRIVVADKDNHRVQVFSAEGVFTLTFGEKGAHVGQFQYPWDVACDAVGNILVSDTRNHRVQLFNWNGIFIAKYGFEGPPTLWKSFDSPRGVSFTPRGDVVVSDFNNHRLALLDGALAGAGAQYIGSEGAGRGHFVRPQGVAVDDRGNIVVADSRNNRIQVFNERGVFAWAVGLPGKNEGELDRPSGICLTPEGRIAVVDFGNSRVQVF